MIFSECLLLDSNLQYLAIQCMFVRICVSIYFPPLASESFVINLKIHTLEDHKNAYSSIKFYMCHMNHLAFEFEMLPI